ncbi:MAG: pseudouridine synthase [Planctomycetota bacterium]
MAQKKKSRTSKANSTPANRESSDNRVRIQKLLASHGHGSRRSCEEFILEGRVEVDGVVVDQLGAKVDPDTQKVTLDGERLIAQKLQYFALNKPPGVVSTSKDPSGRLRVIDLIKTNSRVYNVGRLDKSSEGLILVTNDGELANRLTHPRYGVEKKYSVLVAGTPTLHQLENLKQGIYLAEARVQVTHIRIKKKMKDRTLLEIVLDEGRNREIRRILARIGHKVIQLKRIAIGPLKLGELPVGSHRALTQAEIRLLKKAASNSSPSPTGKPTKKKSTVRKKKAVATRRKNDDKKKPERKKSGHRSKAAKRSATGNSKTRSVKKNRR